MLSRRRWMARCLMLLPMLAAVVGSAQATAAQDWVERRNIGPFHIHSEFDLTPHARVFDDLARIQRDLKRTLAVDRPRAPITMFFLRDRQGYAQFLRENFSDVPERRAVYVQHKGQAFVIAYQSDQFATDLRHETTHALLHADLPMVPLWLDEGLAEYFELPANQRAFDNPHLTKTRWLAALGLAPSMASLEGKGRLAEMGAAEYRYSWGWVHFMLHGPRAAHAELVAYLDDIRRRTPPGRLSERLARRLPDTDKRFVEHFRHWQR